MAALGTDMGKTAGEGDALADAVLSAVPPVALPPLIAPSAGMFAAAAVMGFGFANQMAGAYLGFLKGAMEQTRMMAEALGTAETAGLEEPKPTGSAAQPVVAKAPVPPEGATILPLARSRDTAAPVAPVAPARVEKQARKAAGDGKKPKAAKPEKIAAKVATARGKVKAKDLSDLKRIGGIGPKLEQVLKARGIATLGDIAALDPAEALALDNAIGLDGRIERDGWVRAAAALIG